MNKLTHPEITQQEVDLYFFYRKNGISPGFFLRYFYYLKKTRTTVEAFAEANQEYFDLFGEYRYSSNQSFRNQLKNYLKQ